MVPLKSMLTFTKALRINSMRFCLCEQMTVAKLATDEYDSLLVDKVPFLSKLNVQRQPRSST